MKLLKKLLKVVFALFIGLYIVNGVSKHAPHIFNAIESAWTNSAWINENMIENK